jgi:hypothetical protein
MTTTEIHPDLLSLLGREVFVVHAGGGDVDCVVRDLDRRWPLRADREWRLCQALHYEPGSYFWILDRAGQTVKLDTVTRPGIHGRNAFPRRDVSTPAARAAYLTAKRLRKRRGDASAWAEIGELASADDAAFGAHLADVFGTRVAERLCDMIRAGHVPDAALWRRAVRARALMRFRRPDRVAVNAAADAVRVAGRVLRPTGLRVLVVGPDGTGKSTLGKSLPDACDGLFRRVLHIHWRPRLLPRPGRMVGRSESDSTEPHAKPAHGAVLSLALLMYFWLDCVLGEILRVAPTRARTGLVVIERGWWDMAVDPARYRLHPFPRLVRWGGCALAHPDLVLLLDDVPAAIHLRKPELSEEEIATQLARWSELAPTIGPTVMITGTAAEAAAHARDAVVSALETRALGRLGDGWAGIPTTRNARWLIPRSGRFARNGLRAYQPVTRRARMGWELARPVVGAGALRLFPRSAVPPEVARLVRPHIPPRGTFALSRSFSHAGRFVALLLDASGHECSLAKIALGVEGAAKLEHEREMVDIFAGALESPLRGPQIIAAEPGLLLFRAAPWQPRSRPWNLPVDVAAALGAFFARTGASHGDFAPWNLLRDADGWTLVDWEDSAPGGEPFADVFHYFTQSARLLRRPSAEEIAAALDGRGELGAALVAYSRNAELDLAAARPSFEAFLDRRPGDGGGSMPLLVGSIL